MDFFIILQVSKTACSENDFQVRTKRKKQQRSRKRNQIRYFSNIGITNC